MPGPGEPVEADEEAVLLAGFAAGWVAGASSGWLAAAEPDFEDEVDDFVFDFDSVDAVAEAAPPLTVTSGVIFLIVAAEIPDLDRSSTEEYGLPAMIFFAVAAPTPGRASSSFSVAVLRSTFEEEDVLFDELLDFFVS